MGCQKSASHCGLAIVSELELNVKVTLNIFGTLRTKRWKHRLTLVEEASTMWAPEVALLPPLMRATFRLSKYSQRSLPKHQGAPLPLLKIPALWHP